MRTLTLVAALAFASSLVAGLLLLAAQVEMLFAPGRSPDVTCPAWVYVLVVQSIVLGGVLAAGWLRLLNPATEART